MNRQQIILSKTVMRNVIYRKICKASLLLIMSVMGTGTAWADTSTWDGTTKHTTLSAAGISGAGTVGDPYIINSADKFVAFGALANNSTAYWKLTVDIDLGGHEWPYSGDNAKTFKGHFDGQNDGQNHTISNYKITSVTNKANGLFGTVQGSDATTGRAEIKNLKLDDVTISTTVTLGSTTYIGALVGNANQYVDFRNVQITDANSNGNTVTITLDNINGNCHIGGLIGQYQKNSTMENCTVDKPVIDIQGAGTVGGASNIGGVIGNFTGSSGAITSITDPTPSDVNTTGLTVTSPSVTINKIASTWYIGSVFGRIQNYSDVNYVTVANPTLTYNAVGSPNNDLYLGTLAGHIQGNVGSATATPVATSAKNINITGTSNITIGVDTEVREIKKVKAGVVGYALNNVDINEWNIATSNITVNGSLTTSTDYFGGVIGHVQSNQSAASTDTQTAIDGVELGSSTITVTGNVVKESYIGSIFGRIEGHNGNASNRPKRTTVTNVTTSNTGTTEVVFGSSTTPVSVANVRAGAIGFLGINSELTHSNIYDTQIELNGTLDTGSSYLGGVVAHVQSSNTAFAGVAENGIATKVDDVTVTSSTVNVTGNVTKESYVGSAFGRLDGNVGNATVAPQHVLASNITAGTMAVTFGTNEKPVDVAAIKAGLVGHALNYATVKDWNITTSNVTLNGTIATTAGYLGGVIGQVQSAQSLAAGTDFTNISTVALGSSTVTVTGNITKDSYIGSLFGRVEGSAGNATNYPKRTTVTGVTTTGITKVVFGSNSNNVNVAGVRAGAIGSAAANAEITHSTLANTQIELYGNFVTSTGYLGGIVGQVQSSTTAFPGILQDAIGTKIDDITVKNSNVNVTGNVAKELNVGGGFGRIEGVTSTTVAWQASQVTNIKFKNDGNTGMSSVTIGTNNTNTINYVRAGVAGMAYQNVITSGWDIENASVQVNGKLQTTSNYVGGCIGHVQSNNNAPVTMSNMQITASDVVAINGDIEKDTYIGGAFGRMDQNNGNTNNQPATAENVKITGLDMSFGGNFTQPVYAGGVVGYLAAVNKTLSDASSVINCSVSGQIHSSASKTFVQDKTYAFGGIVGYNNQNATTNRSEIKQCISEVDINLGGYTPSTLAAGLSNLYKNGFAVGGVIGRLDNPSLLPEHLYYSGKIYAPFAVVGPIIGTFQKSLASSATYVYEDYSGEYAAPTLTAAEWEKEKSWYYKNYQLGLSSAVIDQTARSKNYTAATTNVDGVEYLTVTDATFQEVNVINSGKLSKTVLRYTANNKDVDLGIYPNWNTNSVTYPEYYMYYMQGVNRGVYMDNKEFAKALIENEVSILPNMMTTQASGKYTFTTSLGAVERNDKFSITYQWFKKDEVTPTGDTTKEITLTDDQLTTYGGTVYCVITVNGPNSTSKTFTLRGSNAYVVFVNGASGTDNTGDATTRGWTPETAVKTINHANSLLRTTANGGSVDTNIIVVMGTLNSDGDFRSDGKNPATITGRYDGKDYAGIIKIKQINLDGGENVVNTINPATGTKGSNCYVQADTKFEYLTFQANNENDGNNFIELHGNDVTFGKGLSMTNFRNLTKNHGNLEAAQNIPELTIVLTATNLNEATIRRYTTRTKPQVVTFESGRYGRIMGGRYTNGFFKAGTNTSHTILGSAEHPVWAIVNVDIDKNNPNVGTITRSEAPTGKVTNNFTCDINCIIAGLTDGSMYGDYEINVRGGKVGYIVGGNQGNPVPNGSKTFTQPGGKSGDWGQWPNATYFGRTVINVEQDDNLKDIVIDNLYAGGLGREANGEAATSIVDMYMYGHTEINMMSGTVNGNIYGGGAGGVIGVNPWDMHVPYATSEADNPTNAVMNKVQYGEWGAKKSGSPLANVTLHNTTDGGKTYTAEPLNLGTSSTTLNISGGTINGSVYGGGCGYVSNMPKEVCMQGVGSVFGTSNVNVTGGTINGSVYGGSEGSDKYYGATNKYNQKITNIAEMNGTVNLTISGNSTTYPTINGNVYGAGKGITSTKTEEYLRIATTGNADLDDKYKSAVNITVDLPNNVEFPFDIYGGGEMGKVDGNINITLKGGKLTGNVYGGGLGEPAHIEKAKVVGNTTITMAAEGDPVHPLSIGKNDAARNIYGGGNLAQLEGDTELNLNHGSIVGNVYGGGKGLSKAESGAVTGYGKVTGNSIITMNNTTADTSISGDIFGGGALGELTGNTALTINNGTVGGYVYGGGALADVGGSTTVNLYGGSVAGAYGGGLGSNDVAAIVGGDATVQLGTDDGTASSKVTGAGLFGGNNLNGTPKGHAFVHVLKTTTRGQANRNVAGKVANFDVAAVYGGGNKAAYEPTIDDTDDNHDNDTEDGFAEVLIENCDNSIAYVYGGGNAAPVPATKVVIHGADAIDNAFAGGNGEGAGNLGADIGYLNYQRDDLNKYGSGTASIMVDGGTIHNVYGGSNTLGYIRTSTSVNVASSSASGCTLDVGHTYGGGNKADLSCDITLNLTCEKGLKTLFAGANQANILGNATINIYSGVYEQVFGGNNQSGVIKGKLTINVDETGCWPIMIGELYGCGNNAPYSVYGYDSSNNPRTSLAGLSQGTIAEERLPYGDPEVNVISCTKIGRIFGGGYSKGATLYGNTHVNVNLIPGRWNGQTVTPEYQLDANYQMVSNSTAITIPAGIGEIGNIYGGGNEAGVVGNTYVNIYTSKYNSHIDNPNTDYSFDKSPKESGVKILGDVFGGSKGSEKDPDAGKVEGTTNVNIGFE